MLGPVSVGGDTQQGKAALMVAVADPELFAVRLKQLTDMAAQQAAFAQQAKEENQRSEQAKQQAEAINAATMDMVQAQLAKEAELAAREGALAAKAIAVADGQAALAVNQTALKADVTNNADKQSAWMANFEKQRVVFASQVKKAEEDFKQDTAAKHAKLDAEHKAKMEKVEQLTTEGVAKLAAANLALEAAEKTKANYESRLKALKQAMDGK